MGKLKKLVQGELIVGDKAPFNVYTHSRVLLLARGAEVEHEQQVASLLMQGYLDPDEKRINRGGDTTEVQSQRYTSDLNPFLELEGFYQQLLKLHHTLNEGRKPGGLPRGIRDMAERLLLLAARMPDALLGAAHWPVARQSVSLMQSLRSAVLLAVVVQRMQQVEEPVSLLCAALTANLSVLELQDLLSQQQEGLNPIQKSRILGHPEKSAFLLQSLGVEDEVWLEAVLQHHERLDGTGYPRHLKGRAIGVGGRLLGLADSYAAMTQVRQYRSLLTPRQALKELLGGENRQMDAELGSQFLAQLGIYPPGSVVLLANGDTAVVTARGQHLAEPVCAAIRASSGQTYIPPPRRDTSDPSLAINKLLGQELLSKLQPFLFWNIAAARALR
ncbi:HD-GYP domain-containing protein [Marinospirillum alkaliphilum]|uniref:HD domain-containing protein n=1 Tax=Marinospirillum alkaliphilum DSM 21637 TaxID=1122209 RepID=A0A1K1Y097_9GAMM|nr:HD domain-containing phosphohydrolase [Marinospirillum alkaliphilum]SFX55288.1 HD domain-containing protein [Marinospirillum alkaliphilum DSM 21637]